MQRKSILFTGKNELTVVEEACPEPRENELLVQTKRSLISTGTESICFTRNFAPGTHWDEWVKYPFRTGYLAAGRVLAVGKDVEGWSVGDRIAMRTTHTSHVVVPAERAVRIPENVSDEEATWMGLGKITQVGVRRAEHRMGDSIAIVGLGLLGQLVVQYVRLMGARDIIAIDTASMRLEMAAAHGATHTLNMGAAEARQSVMEITDGRGPDVVYDVTGHPAVFAQSLPLPKRFGTLVLLGDAGSPHLQTLTPDVIRRGVKIVGVHDSYPPQTPNDADPWSTQRVHELFLLYVSRAQMRVADLITHRYAPDDAAEAYNMLQRDRLSAMGVLFEWD